MVESFLLERNLNFSNKRKKIPLSKYGFIDNVQIKYGIKPISNPSQKNFDKNKFFLINKYGNSDNRGTATRKVFSIKAKPIQIPKSKMKNLLFLLFIFASANNPIVTKQEKIIS